MRSMGVVWVAMVLFATFVVAACGTSNNTDAGAGSDTGAVNGPVDLSGTFAVVNRLAVFVETPNNPIAPAQVLESLQFTRTTYDQTGTLLTEDTVLCGVTLPLARVFDAENGSRVGLRFGPELEAYLEAGNVSVATSGDFLSGTEISGGTPLTYTPDRVVYLLGVDFAPGTDPETAPLPTLSVMDDGMGGEIITIAEPAGVFWSDTDGDLCPGLVVDGMMSGDPCPGVTVLPDGDPDALSALQDLLPDSVQLAFRVAVTLTGEVFSSNRLAGTIVDPVNDQEIIGFTLGAGSLAITAATVQDNTPRVEVCSDQPECADAESSWVGIRVDGTGGAVNADADGDGAVSCPEILEFIGSNPDLFGLTG